MSKNWESMFWVAAAIMFGIYLSVSVLWHTNDWLFTLSIAGGFYCFWRFSAHKVKSDIKAKELK